MNWVVQVLILQVVVTIALELIIVGIYKLTSRNEVQGRQTNGNS